MSLEIDGVCEQAFKKFTFLVYMMEFALVIGNVTPNTHNTR